MMLIKLNDAVSMYSEPVYKSDHPVMALSVLKKKVKGKYFGLIREIVKREGDVSKPGFLDRSELYIVESKDGLKWKRKEILDIKDVKEIIKKYNHKNTFFIGLEDPDIFVEDDKVHVYFTIAYKFSNKEGFITSLGHAYGKDLHNLKATKPVLSPKINSIDKIAGFKEVAISPIKSKFGRINLTESGYSEGFGSEGVSTIVAVSAKDMGKNWRFVRTVVDPTNLDYGWIKGHASPCHIFDPDFIRYNDLLVGGINGREKTKTVNVTKVFGKFRIGLMLFNPKTGDVPWISEQPLIEDPEARNITFASDFLRTGKKNGILYAHIDDSFVRAYEINAKGLIKFLPKSL